LPERIGLRRTLRFRHAELFERRGVAPVHILRQEITGGRRIDLRQHAFLKFCNLLGFIARFGNVRQRFGGLPLFPQSPNDAPGCSSESEHQHQEYQRCPDNKAAVARHELPHAVADTVRNGPHRLAVHVPLDVRCKLLDGNVPPLRLLAQRHEHDVVQVAAELAGVGGPCGVAGGRRRCGLMSLTVRDRGCGLVFFVRRCSNISRDRLARRPRIDVTNYVLNFLLQTGLEFVRPPAGQ
jgi:hypothetical protein